MALRTCTFTWTQVLPSPNDVTGWGVYYSLVTGGPYTKAGNDEPFVGQLAQYSAVRQIEIPDAVQTTVYFVIDTVYTGGARTEYSNEDYVVFPPRRTLFR